MKAKRSVNPLVDDTKLDYCKEMMEKAAEAWQEASTSGRRCSSSFLPGSY